MATECQSDACCQGRKPCPCPEACELHVDYAGKEPMPTSFKFVLGLLVLFTAVGALSFIASLVAGST